MTARAPAIKVVGVVSGIPTEVDPGEFCAGMVGEHPLREVTRIYKYSHQGSRPTTALKVTFHGVKLLPDHIQVGSVIHKITPFRPTLSVCGRCGTIRHSKGKCHSTKPRCSGTGHKAENCARPRKCCNCGGSHSATYRGCLSLSTSTLAHTLKNQTYMPYYQAVKLAIKDTTVPTTTAPISAKIEPRRAGGAGRPPPLLPAPKLAHTHTLEM